MTIDPTSRGDIEASLLRRWYEKHREGWWRRRSCYWFYVADEFMLAFMDEAKRIEALDDLQLCLEYDDRDKS
jgi:hypothetical protein